MLVIDLGQDVKFGIEKVDDLNLTLYKWKLVNKKSGDKAWEWVRTGTYWPDLPQACRGIMKMVSIDKVKDAKSLNHYLGEMREISGKIEEAMRIAV